MAPDATFHTPAAWIFVVDPAEVDLVGLLSEDDALLALPVPPGADLVPGPGAAAHLWVRDPTGRVPEAVYATGSVVGPVGDDGTVAVGLDALARPVDGPALLADPAFAGSALAGARPGPVALDAAQAARLAAADLTPGTPHPALEAVGPGDGDADEDEDDGIELPALEVRLVEDTLLVVPAVDHDGWTVVHGDADMVEVVERPEVHATFLDAVEYVAAVADRAGASLPVVDLDDGIEAVAVLDGGDGVWAVVKTARDRFSLLWVDDDGETEVVDEYASLREAILLPVLDEALFGGTDDPGPPA